MASETETTQKTIPAQTTLNQSFTGCVKWFNNGLNYGFITVLSDGEYRNTDVFVHQSNIRTGRDCFRTLYTGECVQFELSKSDNEKHPFHAINVQGFNGVKLRCEAPRGIGFGRDRGNGRSRGFNRGHTRGRGRGRGRDSRHRNTELDQHDNSEVATQEGKTIDTSNSTNVAETTQQTNDATVVESVSAEVASIAVSDIKGRYRGRKVSA